MTTPQHIAQLLYRYLYGTITESEATALSEWVDQSDDHRVLFAEVNDNKQLGETIGMMHPDEWQRIDANILGKVREGIKFKEEVTAIPVHRVHFLRTAW